MWNGGAICLVRDMNLLILVHSRSNFQKLAEPENKEAQISFRKGRVYVDQYAGQPKARRKDMWSGEYVFKLVYFRHHNSKTM